jgi:hypothetical protein
MFIRKFIGIGAAAIFMMAAGYAQAAQQPSDQATSRAREATSTPITLVGCLIREADYRTAHNLGKGGLGGMRTGSDFVLVDAKTIAAGETATAPAGVAAGASCSEQGTGQSYRMAGKQEGALKPLAGHYVVVTGEFEHAHDARAAAGETAAHLPPEIVIASFREAPVAATAATTEPAAPAATAPASPAPAPSSTAPPSVGTSGEAKRMPKTASDLPLITLLAVLSLTAALGLRIVRRRAF